MLKNVMIFMLILTVFTGCTRIEFDSFNPTTTTLRWIITGDKDE